MAIEAGWQEAAALERWLGRILAAETVDHAELASGDALLHAVPLRSEGALERWRGRLSDYPEPLRQALVSDAAWHWRPPWSRLPLARRSDRLRLAEGLLHDCQGVLRILFALNRLWEPDWKWIHRRIDALATRPPRLGERLDAVVAGADPEQAVRACYALILDTLALAGDGDDIRRAREWISGELTRCP